MLAGKKVLLVEDEYFLADEARRALVQAGALVIGPFAEVADGFEAVSSNPDLSAAVLDINLRGTPVYEVAKVLRERDIPFLFTTGYDKAAIPAAYQDVPRCEKPAKVDEFVRLLDGLLPA